METQHLVPVGAHTRAPLQIKFAVVGLIAVDMNNATTILGNPMECLAHQTMNADFLFDPVKFQDHPNEALGMHAGLGLVSVQIHGTDRAKF